MAQAIKISKEGYSVDSGDNNLIFNSDHPLLKIHKRGSGQMTVAGNNLLAGEEYIIDHDLDIIPMYFIRGQVLENMTTENISTNLFNYPQMRYTGLGVYLYEKVIAYKNKLVIKWHYPQLTAPKSILFDYWIFEDPIV